jgi:DNA invertase Pin-like site-specific DNA recombinase
MKKEVRMMILRAGGCEDRIAATKQLAIALGVDRMTTFRWWKNGRIPKWWIDRVEELASKTPDFASLPTAESTTCKNGPESKASL